MARGQPRLDVALRARNWLWYWLVKCLTKLSDDTLDGLFAGTAGNRDARLRVFYRFRSLGSSPTDERGFRKSGVSVYHRVHDASNPDRVKVESAREVFESQLWELLLDPDLPLSRCHEIAASLTQSLGLTRISRAESELLRRVVDDPQLLIDLGHQRSDEHSLSIFHDSSSINVITLLAALYRISIAHHDLSRAVALKDAAERCAFLFVFKWRPPKFLEALFLQLLADRVFGNIWLTEIDWPAVSGSKVQDKPIKQTESRRRREIHSFVNWYISYSRAPGNTTRREFGLPVVLSPALAWTRENRELLENWRSEIEYEGGKAAVLEDSPFESERELAASIRRNSQRVRNAATTVLSGVLRGTSTQTAASISKPDLQFPDQSGLDARYCPF